MENTKAPRKTTKRRSPGLNPRAVEAIYARLSAINPDPRTELQYSSAFTLLVAVALSAQSTDIGVNKATTPLFSRADTPQAMLALGEDAVREHIRTLGLYRNKAKNLIAMCQILVNQHDGEVPHEREALEALPGVGRKTANVILNEWFGEPTIAVDTHIFRVANRTRLAPGQTPDAVEARLLEATPEPYRKGAHHWLILHGRYVCKARTPECWRCPIAQWCRYTDKTPAPRTCVPLSKTGGSSKARATARAKRSPASGA
jgi:endonuclease III